jgi:hypothetical protein
MPFKDHLRQVYCRVQNSTKLMVGSTKLQLFPMGENNQNYKLLASGEVILTTNYQVHPIKTTYSL